MCVKELPSRLIHVDFLPAQRGFFLRQSEPRTEECILFPLSSLAAARIYRRTQGAGPMERQYVIKNDFPQKRELC